MLTVLTFNVLAPNFAAPKYYPQDFDDYLSKNRRRVSTTLFLTDIKNKCDIIALQEVTSDTFIHDDHVFEGEFNYFNGLLCDDFIGMFFPHDKTYWNNYFDKTGEYSYIKNGNALFLRKSVFTIPIWSDIPLGTGNHSIKADAVHLPTMRNIHVLNVHFENIDENVRITELCAAVDTMSSCHDNNDITIILGDFNTKISPIIEKITHDFKDSMIEINNKTPTFSFTYNDPIDHIIYMGNDIVPIHDLSRVIDNGLYNKYPVLYPTDVLGSLRLRESLELHGSDHFPVITTFAI